MPFDSPPSAAIPAHQPLHVPGVHGYADRKSLHAGERLSFFVSSDRPWTLSVCRLGADIAGRSDDVVLHRFAPSPARVQPIHPGAYLHVPKGLDPRLPPPALSFEGWVKPWSVARRQALVTQADLPARPGFGLFIEPGGLLAWQVGDGEPLRATRPLDERRWQHVAATWAPDAAGGGRARLWIDGAEAGSGAVGALALPAGVPLRLGACGMDGLAALFLDADIAMPALHAVALDEATVRARHAARGLRAAVGREVLACWPLREERGERVADGSGHQRTGRIVNLGTWMVAAPAFKPEAVPEHGDGGYDPLSDPARGHALRLASDDLYDCRWDATHSFTVPADAPPGFYVGRVRFALDGREADYDITFIVRRAADAPPAPLLVLASASSWLAYAATPFARNTADDPVWPRRSVGLENSHPEAPAYNSYTFHRAGQPSYQTGLRMPWPNASPAALYDPAGSGFSQWARLERHLHVWLDREGRDWDIASDIDLHRDPGLLARHRCVVVNGHSEYWSVPAIDGLDRFLSLGGRAIVLSGNTMYLRVSFDEQLGVMEQRKVDDPRHDPDAAGAALGPPAGAFGEQYHSQDWARGGQLKLAGRPAAEVIGLETAGWGFADASDFGVYHVAEPGHFLFNTPTALGLARGDTFGHAPGGGLPRAIGHEWDLSVATLARMTRTVPEGASLPEPPGGMTVIAQGLRDVPGRLDAYLDYFSNPTESLGGLSAEMILWDRPRGGRVFHAGAVGAAWVVGSDPRFDALLRNVLHHFLEG